MKRKPTGFVARCQCGVIIEARVLAVRPMARDPHDDSEDPPQAVSVEYDWHGEIHHATVAGWRLILVRREKRREPAQLELAL